MLLDGLEYARRDNGIAPMERGAGEFEVECEKGFDERLDVCEGAAVGAGRDEFGALAVLRDLACVVVRRDCPLICDVLLDFVRVHVGREVALDVL